METKSTTEELSKDARENIIVVNSHKLFAIQALAFVSMCLHTKGTIIRFN